MDEEYEIQRMSRLKAKVLSLPFEPGVYIMLDKSSEVIYVGKAKKLKNRVSSYFQDQQSHTEKTRRLVADINDFNFIVAANEHEALMLECSLIKRHQPKYNILLKDGKGFQYIRLDTREPYPRLSVDSKPKNDGAKWFGPYYSIHAAYAAMNALVETFKLPECSKVFPRDIRKQRPCLNSHIGRCMAVCSGNISADDYHVIIDQVVEVLEGKYETLANRLLSEMEEASEKLLFEYAAELRDKHKAVLKLGLKQNVITGKLADTDVVGFYQDARTAIVILRYLDGSLMDKRTELLEQSVEGTPNEILDAFLTQYYTFEGALPRSILLPFHIDSQESLESMLTDNAGHKVEISTPQRGIKMEYIRLAAKNAREEAERVTTRTDRGTRISKLLGDALGFSEIPNRIEAYDISNLAGTDVVASMTVYQSGQPSRKDYRRFKIKSVVGQDDYSSMHEVITRRFTHLKDGDPRFIPAPDLLLIDGGVEHAKIALDAQRNLGYDIPIFGMVKDGRHRTRALVSPDGKEISINGNPQLFGFVGRIQEETHRFAIEYNRSLRKKRIYGSELDKIEGVGEARRSALLKKFGSLKKIKLATLDELSQVVPEKVALSIINYFSEEQGSAIPD